MLEMLCLSGNVLSGIIAFYIGSIQEKTLINKMFLVYFAIDCVIGATDPYFLFKLFRERSVMLLYILISVGEVRFLITPKLLSSLNIDIFSNLQPQVQVQVKSRSVQFNSLEFDYLSLL